MNLEPQVNSLPKKMNTAYPNQRDVLRTGAVLYPAHPRLSDPRFALVAEGLVILVLGSCRPRSEERTDFHQVFARAPPTDNCTGYPNLTRIGCQTFTEFSCVTARFGRVRSSVSLFNQVEGFSLTGCCNCMLERSGKCSNG